MISLTKIRELNLSTLSRTIPTHLSAASGLVCLDSYLYVVADDELHLGVFCKGKTKPGHLIRLVDGELPVRMPDRKKNKPDFEALALLPAHVNYPHGALLALGSGSAENRRAGILLGLDAQGATYGAPMAVDLTSILTSLDEKFPKLNIEGAVVCGEELRLFQRGHKNHGENAIIRFELAPLLEIFSSTRTNAIKPFAIDELDLGKIDGIPLGLTDAAVLPDGKMVFTAVSERSEDAYNDGPCLGAAIGIAGDNGHLHCLHLLDKAHKVEGVDARVDGDVLRLLLVTDADDRNLPAALFSATIPIAD